MTDARRHHYVPEFYLRGFTARDTPGKVFVYDKDSGTTRGMSVKNAAVRRDYYRLHEAEAHGISPNIIEDMLSVSEGKASIILPKLCRQETLSNNERSSWAEFLALTYVRGPSTRQMVADVYGAVRADSDHVALYPAALK